MDSRPRAQTEMPNDSLLPFFPFDFGILNKEYSRMLKGREGERRSLGAGEQEE